MSETSEGLWRRLQAALATLGALPAGNATPAEVARHAGSVLGDDVVQRFVDGYYYPWLYGSGLARLSEAEAGVLVADLEGRAARRPAPQPAAAPSPVPKLELRPAEAQGGEPEEEAARLAPPLASVPPPTPPVEAAAVPVRPQPLVGGEARPAGEPPSAPPAALPAPPVPSPAAAPAPPPRRLVQPGYRFPLVHHVIVWNLVVGMALLGRHFYSSQGPSGGAIALITGALLFLLVMGIRGRLIAGMYERGENELRLGCVDQGLLWVLAVWLTLMTVSGVMVLLGY